MRILRSFVWGWALLAGGARLISAQELFGRVVDSSNGAGVAAAGVFLLDQSRSPVASFLTDSLGWYALSAPGAGSYYLAAQRFGYFETESPLVAVSLGGRYPLDIELRPEPIRLDPLLVTVRNDRMERWLTLRLGGNPNATFGYRAIQGIRLEEAKFKSEDNTELLRWLYIPVSHARDVCLGSRMPKIDRATLRVGPPTCGKLFVDDLPVAAEHLDTIDQESIAVVVLLPPNVHLFTRAFDWSARPGR